MALTEADKTFTQAKTSTGTKGPVFVGSSSKKKKTKPTFDAAAEQAKLRQAQERAAIESIRRKEQEALTGLERQEAEIAPQFREARRATTASSELGGMRFREGIAGQGLTGAGAEARIRQTGALQRDIGGLRQEEARQFGDIARTRADIGRAAESDIQATRAGIQAQSIQDLINLRQQEQAREFQEAQLTGQFRGEQTLAGQQAQQIGQQRALQTQQLEQAIATQDINTLVQSNMGDLMAAMNQFPVGSREHNALRVAREEKVRQQQEKERQLLEQQRLITRQQEQDELSRQIALREIVERERTGGATRANIQSQIDARAREAALEIQQGGATDTSILNAASKLVAATESSETPLSIAEAVTQVRNALTEATTQPTGTATEAQDIRARLGLNR